MRNKDLTSHGIARNSRHRTHGAAARHGAVRLVSIGLALVVGAGTGAAGVQPNASPVRDNRGLRATSGSCVALAPLTRLTLTTQPSCVRTSTVTIDIKMSGAETTIVGGQYFVAYDTNYLQFTEADPGDAPFTRQIHEVVDPYAGPGVGYIDYATGIQDGGAGTSADTTMARLSFTVIQESCMPVSSLVTWRAVGPDDAITKLSDANADAVVAIDEDLGPLKLDQTGPVMAGCPANTTYLCVEEVPGGANVTAMDACDGAVAVIASEQTTPGDCPNRMTIVRTWTATDSCGNSNACSQTISVDDTVQPSITCPGDIEVSADTSCTATVSVGTPTVGDNCTSATTYAGVRDDDAALGAAYPLGVTTITWTATDACGNTKSCPQTVTVNGANTVTGLVVDLEGNYAPVSRCIRFVPTPGACTAGGVYQTLNFVDHDGDDANHNGIVDSTEGGLNTRATPARAIVPSIDNPVALALPCGPYTQLCAKDEQHTMWASTTLSPSGSTFAAGPAILLRGGDTDNDGDVDINDVTYFIFRFGTLASAGGCPWSGARDADFSNSGLVFGEDYAFLSANWLGFSTCPCLMPLMDGTGGAGPHPIAELSDAIAVPTNLLRSEVAAAVDFNSDGVFDYRDVERFERLHGYSGELSAKLRAAGQPAIQKALRPPTGK